MCNKAKSADDVPSTPQTTDTLATFLAPLLGKRLAADWVCGCGELNFASRSKCRLCKRAKTNAVVAVADDDEQRAAPTLSQPETNTTAPRGDVPVEVLCSIDIERAGPALQYGILMIGVCVGLGNGTVLEKAAFCWKIKAERENFDATTWDEFWCKHVDVLERIYANATDNPLGEFVAFMQRLEAKHGPFGRKHKKKVNFRFCGDNLPYDLGHISIAMAKAGHRFHVQEMFDDYVSACDPTERLRLMTPARRASITRECKAPHDHWAVNDATRNYELMVGTLRLAAQQGW